MLIQKKIKNHFKFYLKKINFDIITNKLLYIFNFFFFELWNINYIFF